MHVLNVRVSLFYEIYNLMNFAGPSPEAQNRNRTSNAGRPGTRLGPPLCIYTV